MTKEEILKKKQEEMGYKLSKGEEKKRAFEEERERKLREDKERARIK